MTDQTPENTQLFLTAAMPCPYLPGKQERKLFTHLTRNKQGGLVDHLLRNGFRRSQNIAYAPYCDACNACISVRVIVDRFQPEGSLRRVVPRNRDVVSRRVEK